ncbi:GNAT family N-acetyltransferase [Thermogemmatispora carboxidivorans]|uniref:GNAT family N-acetyltransferase n=1 Tax=Thermogemmatispora carboxidivorans TaxID=1382306 RepID=UPI00069975AA|nr:GNAT family N-acetyltransferase [Thermogemmatispora carboxidivorans]
MPFTDSSPADPQYVRDLGDGLRLRWSRPEDVEELARLECEVFLNGPADPLNQPLAWHVRELLSGSHPLMGSQDFALVEDTRRSSRRVVACACLWRQPWDYEDVRLLVGRPELVVSDPDYRHRGLIRALFELLHARSEAEGALTQAITGIPYFYRQFGYEYALALDGYLSFPVALIPPAPEEGREPVRLRDATLEDLPAIMALYEAHRHQGGFAVSTPISEEWWRYHLLHQQGCRTGEHWHIQVIGSDSESFLGFLVMPTKRWRSLVPVMHCFEMVSGIDLFRLLPSVLRAILARGHQIPVLRDAEEIDHLRIFLSDEHPIRAALLRLPDRYGEPLTVRSSRSYAWYVRVPDLAAFLRRVAPVLERRLSRSPLAGYSGRLRLHFYGRELVLHFQAGRLESVQELKSAFDYEQAEAAFPPQAFLPLLFGYRSLDELSYAFPDIEVKPTAELLLQSLFPKRPSWALPLG